MEKKMLAIGLVVLMMASFSFGSILTFIPSKTAVQQGESFTVQIKLLNAVDIKNGDFWLNTTAPLGTFQVMSYTPGAFSDYGATGAVYPLDLPDTGYVADYGPLGTAGQTGDLLLGTLSIKALTSAPVGAYTISSFSDFTWFFQPNGTQVDPACITGAAVNVVPEPFSIALLSLGGLGLLRRRS